MIIVLKTKSFDFDKLELLADAGIVDQADAEPCGIAFRADLINWVIEDPFKSDRCYIMYNDMPGQTTVFQPFNEVVKLWGDCLNEQK